MTDTNGEVLTLESLRGPDEHAGHDHAAHDDHEGHNH